MAAGAGPEPLVSVLYVSEAGALFDDDALDALLAQSRGNNADRGVTGVLLYRDGRFVQVLEGREDVVRDLVSVIRRDERHHDVRLLADERIEARRFGDWTMAYRSWSAPDGGRPEGFRDTFDDIAAATDDATALRAARELLLWFAYRTATGG